MGGCKTNSGDRVQREWKIPAMLTRFHWKGDFYMPLDKFPGALADAKGYVVIPDLQTYLNSPFLDHRGSAMNPRLGVPGGISKLPNYVRIKP
jgi:hypothetical protein